MIKPQDIEAQALKLQEVVLKAQKEPGLADLQILLSLTRFVNLTSIGVARVGVALGRRVDKSSSSRARLSSCLADMSFGAVLSGSA